MSKKIAKETLNTQDIVRRKVRKIETRFELLRTMLSIVIALGIVLMVIALVSKQPLEAIRLLLLGPISTFRRFGNVLELMIPLTFTGLAMTIVFKSNRFNMAADSAFYLSAMTACMVGLYSPFPPVVTIILALVAGMITGALIGFIPAILNQKFGASELVTSLMLNYVIGFLVKYLFSYVVRDPYNANLQSYPLKDGVNLGILIPGTRVHFGLVIVLLVVIAAYILLYKTKWGYALRTTGTNEKFAVYTGISVPVVIVLAQVFGTAIAGLGGAVEMLGIYTRFRWTDSPGYGFDGVILATLARNNPAGVPFAAFFLAYIRVGADILNRSADIPAEIISVVQATIILLIAAKAFLSTWKQREIVKQSGALQAGGK